MFGARDTGRKLFPRTQEFVRHAITLDNAAFQRTPARTGPTLPSRDGSIPEAIITGATLNRLQLLKTVVKFNGILPANSHRTL